MPRMGPDRRETAIFLHVPKAAGTTLQRVTERHYRPSEIFFLGSRVQDAIDDLRALDPADRARLRLVHGHLAYGLHEALPGPCSYFTLLREPVDRVASFFYFVREQGDHYLYDLSRSAGMDLAGFMESGVTIMVDNGQTRQISGVWDDVAYGACDREVLELAKENLRRSFDVVGLSERFDESLLMLGRRYGWRHLYYTRENVTTRRPPRRELPRTHRLAVERYNALDAELHAFATERFADRLAALGPGFPREVDSFRRRNARLGTAYSMGWRAWLKASRTVRRERRGGQRHGAAVPGA
jgi:hypothetical protein